MLGALQEFDEPGVMVEKRVVGRPAEGGPEFFQFLLGQGGAHLVGHVDAGQAVGGRNNTPGGLLI